MESVMNNKNEEESEKETAKNETKETENETEKMDLKKNWSEMADKFLNKQDQPVKEGEKIEVSYQNASEGDRERPWVISNKIVTLGEMKDEHNTTMFIPLISIYETKAENVRLNDWAKIKVQNKQFLVCKKTLLFMTNCICEPLYDKSNTVVTHITVHSDAAKGSEENKLYWKTQFAKYMKVGSMTWEEVRTQVDIKETLEEQLGAMHIEEKVVGDDDEQKV